MKLLTICGSLRSGSFNRAICNTLPELAPDGWEIEDAPGFGDLPLYNADDYSAHGFPDRVAEIAEHIRAADGVVIVSPEYNFSVPGGLKNAIDWISRLPDQPFKNKPVALQSAAAGMLGGSRMQYHMRQVMVFLEARVFTKPEVFVSFAKSKVDGSGEKIADETTREMMRAQLTAFTAEITS
ncbi:NAD(P)H-dependent oxidoreductase [Hoeflea sp. WL0058]|uniref:NAD(P)H-dependent oxidoreductase n=1 Tax=Flavimaribacter sediminis TaxID=2865987 RepID=A0AAE2ZQX2_9HYPH|nr:NADPH-dependent FMN reductase [Flavimaribacter sediminis]MBW8639325.1 NAD(P)H-dependent oxidoreductase [Flavimaribacter sediminis]